MDATNTKKIPKGYKETEVGVIPEEWEIKPIRSFSFCYSGGTPNTNVAQYYDGDIPWITSGDLNYFKVIDVKGRISVEGLRSSSAKMVSKDTLLMALYGATAGVVAITKIEAAINQAILAIDTTKVVTEYLFYFLTAKKDEIVSTYTQGGQPNLSGELVKSYQAVIPPLSEQRVIAEALSNTDELLAALDALIEKKRAIKRGAMQELLTGKRRLPGFSGKWEKKRLGEIFELSGGLSASRDQLSDEGYCYLHYGDIHLSDHTFINVKREYMSLPKLKIALRYVKKSSLLSDGDVVFVDASEDDEGASKHIVIENPTDLPYISGLHTIVAKSKTDDLCIGFKKYCFKTRQVKDQFKYYAVGTKVTGVNKMTIARIDITFPPLPEQSAIAAVLSDMDAEIEALEERREKTRAIKRGMMQELLTGRIRII